MALSGPRSRAGAGPGTAALCPRRQYISHADQCVCHHSQSHPAFHPFGTAITASSQSVPPLQDANPALTTSAPALRLPEPAAVFLLLPFRAARISVRYGHPLHALFLDGLLLRPRIIARVRRRQV